MLIFVVAGVIFWGGVIEASELALRPSLICDEAGKEDEWKKGEADIRKKFECELSLQGKMVRLDKVIPDIIRGKNNPCYVVEDLEAFSVRYFTGELYSDSGRAQFYTKTCILKLVGIVEYDIAAVHEYDRNLSVFKSGLTELAIPIGYIFDKKSNRLYFVEEYIPGGIVYKFRISNDKKREELVEKLGRLVGKMYSLNIESQVKDLADLGHIRIREGEIALTDVQFEEISRPKDITEHYGYKELMELICDLSRMSEIGEDGTKKLEQVFDKSCRQEIERLTRAEKLTKAIGKVSPASSQTGTCP